MDKDKGVKEPTALLMDKGNSCDFHGPFLLALAILGEGRCSGTRTATALPLQLNFLLGLWTTVWVLHGLQHPDFLARVGRAASFNRKYRLTCQTVETTLFVVSGRKEGGNGGLHMVFCCPAQTLDIPGRHNWAQQRNCEQWWEGAPGRMWIGCLEGSLGRAAASPQWTHTWVFKIWGKLGFFRDTEMTVTGKPLKTAAPEVGWGSLQRIVF